MDKDLAIRTIKETYNQVALAAPPAHEEDMEQENKFWEILTKYHPNARDYDGPEALFKILPRLGEQKLVNIATEVGKELFSAEAHVYDLQAEYICNEFGQEAMEKANYGNGVDDGCVETKVYGVGKLTTHFNGNANHPDEVNADHDFEYNHKDEEE